MARAAERPSPVTQRGRLPSWALPALVAAVTFIAFLPALNADFVAWDDDTNFLRNQDYRGLGGAQLRWMWSTFLLGHYVPLTWMTLGLDYTLWGMNPFGYHLTNVLLHALNAALVHAVTLSLFRAAGQTDGAIATRTRVAAAAGALFFSLHPLRVESVAWITERRDVLSLAFYLLSLLAYLRSVHLRDRGRPAYYLALLLFACALLSKATVVTLPAVLLLLNIWPLRRVRAAGTEGGGWPRVALEVAPFLILSAAFSLLSIVALSPGPQLPIGGKIALSAYGVLFYLQKTLVPTGLAALYQMVKPIDPFATKYLVSYGLVAVLVSGSYLLRRRWPSVPAALAAWGVTVFPLLGIVQNGAQFAADRYTYHAAPAFSVLVACGLLVLPSSRARFVHGLAALALAAFAVGTWRQLSYWKDSERLWARVLAVGESAIARTAYGNVLTRKGRLDEAVAHYERSLALDPKSTEALNNLGVAASREGRLEDAIVLFRRAIAIQPDYYEAFSNWGVVLSRQGKLDEAQTRFRRSLSLRPDFADAEVNWGNALMRAGNPAAALGHYESALRMKADHVDAHLNFGVGLATLGRRDAARREWREVLRLDPGNAIARDYLSRLPAP